MCTTHQKVYNAFINCISRSISEFYENSNRTAMKISRIEIENFRGIDSLTLDLTGPGGKPLDLVVLAGPNGCGKTSVMEACLLALGHDELLGNRAESKENIRFGNSDFSIRCNVVTKDQDGSFNEHPICRTSTVKKLHFAKNPVAFFSSWRYPKLVGSVSISSGKKENKLPDIEENRLLRIKQHIVNFSAYKLFKQDTHYEYNPEDPLIPILEAWEYFYPSKKSFFKVLPAGIDVDEGFDVFLVVTGIVAPIPIDSLSSGEIEVFTMLGSFVIYYSSCDIVFIDEPELHLHPAWHRAVLHAIQTVLPNTQLICATHSWEILDSVKSYERFTILDDDDPRIRMVESANIDEIQA